MYCASRSFITRGLADSYRAGIADALATIAPALLTPGRGRPPEAVLRAALYGHAFSPARARTDPGPPATAALAWARHHSLPLAAHPRLAIPCRRGRITTFHADRTHVARALHADATRIARRAPILAHRNTPGSHGQVWVHAGAQESGEQSAWPHQQCHELIRASALWICLLDRGQESSRTSRPRTS
jgi:hypothetical protein